MADSTAFCQSPIGHFGFTRRAAVPTSPTNRDRMCPHLCGARQRLPFSWPVPNQYVSPPLTRSLMCSGKRATSSQEKQLGAATFSTTRNKAGPASVTGPVSNCSSHGCCRGTNHAPINLLVCTGRPQTKPSTLLPNILTRRAIADHAQTTSRGMYCEPASV